MGSGEKITAHRPFVGSLRLRSASCLTVVVIVFTLPKRQGAEGVVLPFGNLLEYGDEITRREWQDEESVRHGRWG